MNLTQETKDLLKLAMLSHEACAHTDPKLCCLLIYAEIALRRDYPLEDGEIEACGNYIAEVVLSGLIEKGLVEPVGVSEDGDFIIGLTEKGVEVEKRIRREEQ